MTAKRFGFEMDNNCYKCICDTVDGKLYTDKKQVVDLLNEQHETIHSLISDSEKYRKLSIQFDNRNKELVSENALLEKENEQLKERNKNQYEQLTQLWKLIENEDYNTLRSMLNQLEEDEERLQQEWRTYGDVE